MELLVLISFGVLILLGKIRFVEAKRQRRRDYYREYLNSDAWQRKRYVVMKRDNWCCRYCGAEATQVHHLRYAKYNIGKEPIDWLVSVCKSCHKFQHGKSYAGIGQAKDSSGVNIESQEGRHSHRLRK